MKVRFTTPLIGPDTVRSVGDIADVPASEAASLIAAGYAEPVKVVLKLETATVPAAPLETMSDFDGLAPADVTPKDTTK